MIQTKLARTDTVFGHALVIPQRYQPPTPTPLTLQNLSEAAREIVIDLGILQARQRIAVEQPEIIGLRILDFLTSKKIRRKGQTPRSGSFYTSMLDKMLPAIREGRPLLFSSLCLCICWTNTRLVGNSPYPHMASYLGIENLHKIAAGIRELYEPGVEFVLGYEGYLFQSLYFHPDAVVDYSLSILRELNDVAYRVMGNDAQRSNPVRIVDARWMIEQVYGSFQKFLTEVATYRRTVKLEQLKEWQDWYRNANAATFFPSQRSFDEYTQRAASWREAIRHFKYSGGRYNTGFVGFSPDAIPFTPGGRKTDILALQLVPRSSFLPHQRAITFDSQTNRWNMQSFDEINCSNDPYVPCYVPRYAYPFYYEKLAA